MDEFHQQVLARLDAGLVVAIVVGIVVVLTAGLATAGLIRRG